MRPTHAGGIVYRIRDGFPEFLLVTARRNPQQWVYPKGHIEPGEDAERAAVREVEEEAGVQATIVEPLDDVEIDLVHEHQKIRYFLMEAKDDGVPREGRRSCWVRADDALRSLAFPESRASLRQAVDVLMRRRERRTQAS